MAMNLGKFGEMVRPGEAWHAAVHEGCKDLHGRATEQQQSGKPPLWGVIPALDSLYFVLQKRLKYWEDLHTGI